MDAGHTDLNAAANTLAPSSQRTLVHTCWVCRFMDHTFVWRPRYKRHFNAECLSAIAAAVQRCEATSDTQVCVIAEHTLPYSYLRKRLSVRDRAITLFGKHRVWDTEHNTGVLVYVNWVERTVEIVADRGVSGRVAQQQWDTWAQQLRAAFAQQQYREGIVAAIDAIVRSAQTGQIGDGKIFVSDLGDAI